jgi:transposase
VQAARAPDRDRSATFDLHGVQCIDAAGSTIARTRLDGSAPRGARALGRAPQHDGPHVTRLGALSSPGREAVMTGAGATDADGCRADVHAVLGPTRREGDSIVAANLSAHKAAGVQAASAATGARRLYVPPYAPALTPREPCWSTLKTCLRAAKARTREARDEAITGALATVTEADARAWFAHCGYVLH